MGSKTGHEGGGTGTVTKTASKWAGARKVPIRTLTARIHSAFSEASNALHSFRTAGFVQGLGPYEQDTPTTDQMKTRAMERILATCIMARPESVQM